ncbi:DUF7507 domain-containing protein [Flavobacterium aestivum]|uniref:DUF7507 domain-containing protein n=1 Tax=Flavobacterium aestivum TaxID=3003257 RepID=UPI002482C35A|nr:gliding motility-associated C-terminal domain-containing protein [Flavobacterium aestivum]
MKTFFTHSTKLFTFFLVCFLSYSTITIAQIGTGTVTVNPPSGGFSILGNLQANSTAGDWLAGTGSGGFVLTNAGVPVNSVTTFHLTDPYSTSDNIFSGGIKIDDNPNIMTWVTGGANDKTDMNNVLLHFTTKDGHVWAVFAADRLSASTANAYMDFEFLQDRLTKNYSAGNLSGGFSTSVPLSSSGGRTENDFILTVTFTSGMAGFEYSVWENDGTGYKYVSHTPPANSVYAATNSGTINTPSLYKVFGGNTYSTNTFIEGAVDLTALLKDVDPCANIRIKSIFVKSKTSAGGGAQPKDFADPIDVNFLLTTAAGIISGESTVCSVSNSTELKLSGQTGTVDRWESSPNGTSNWTTIPSTSGVTTYTASGLTTTTYYRAVVNGACGTVFSEPVSIKVTQLPTASISYTGSPWCKTVTPQSVTLTGNTGGVYSSTAGLTINASTGEITPSTSTAGTYTVTYTIAAAGGCSAVTATTSVTITALPNANISYSGSPWCTTATTQSVTLTGTGVYTGGVYSSTAGLTIDPSTGAITPSTSTAGTYTVTYTIAAAGGCAAVTATTSVTITALPTANISYSDSPWCTTATAQSVTLTGTGVYTGGVYSSTAGLTINAATGEITPSTSTAGTYTVTYTIAAAAGCAAVTATTSVTITALPTANISYSGSPWCTTATAQSVTLTGTGVYTGGVYSSTAGLIIDAATGEITPSTSTAGTYTVTYTIAAAGGCAAVTATTLVTITALPTASISYSDSPWCTTAASQSVALTGNTGGVYSSTAGLTINAATGEIIPSTSTAGTYTVTYTIAAAGGCAAVAATTSVTITALPTANISYSGSPWCTTATAKSVTLTGTGVYTGGVYSSTAGLTINASTGEITPSTSTAGTYTVTYTIAAAGGCSAVTATTSVTITALPTANISYSGSPWCTTATTKSVTLTGTGAYTGGVYSSTAGLTIDPSTGAITPSTSTDGTYTVTYTVAAASGCAVVTATTSVTITTLPTANISYSGSPWCTTATTQSVTLTGATGGVYSSTVGLTIDASTGEITPSTSTAGTYTVTYTIAASSGCAAVTATASVTITALPTANISYSGSPWCTTATVKSVTLTGTGAYTGGVYSSTAGLTINASTGAITPSTSTAGTYTVTYTTAAAGGCAAVTAITSVTITTLPNANISYSGSPWCTTATTQSVTLTGATGGVYSSTVGLTIDASTGEITPSTSTAGTYTVTYTIAASSGCAAVTATTSVTITALPTANISYSGSPWCTTATAKSVTLTGTGAYTGGVYSSTAGLTINASTGAITPSTSTAGTYTVTYTTVAAGGCAAVTATTSITITTLPTANISYSGSPWCTTATTQSVTLTGTGVYTGGVYSSTAGLTIDAATGEITPSTSTAGTYTITYTITAAGGCNAVTATTSVKITALPTANISYSGSPWCTSATVKSVTLTGTGVYTGGVYSSTAGLTINASTGAITPSTSTAGTYTVTYTIAAAGGCAAVTATTSVTITTLPTASISYSGSPWCTTATTQSVTLTGTGIYTGGVYSSTAGLTIDAATGEITPSTSTAGTYTVTYTIAAAGGCAAVTATTSVKITALPTANISYSGSPWCTSATAKLVTLTGTGVYTGGVYSSTVGLTINASTGTITPSTSTAGTYTVTYTIAAAGGCAAVTATTSVTITTLPTAHISYSGSPWCTSVTTQSVTLTGTGIYTGGIYSSTAGLTIDAATGEITPSSSTAGTYTVTYTIAAAGGCAAVTATTSVTVNSLPAPPISGGNITECMAPSIQTLTATATVPAGQHIDWYTTAIGGSSISSPTLNTVGTVTYYAQAVNNTTLCTNLNRTPVILTINSCSVEITKDGTYQDTNADGITNIGDKVIYNFVITNTSNVTLTNIKVTDINAVVSGGPIASLAPGASDSSTFTASHAITQNEIDSGVVYNWATAIGTPPTGADVKDTSTDPTPCTSCPINPQCPDCTMTPLTQTPKITLVKSNNIEVGPNGCATLAVGDVVTYTFTVTNPGNVSLHNITVTDPHTGLSAIVLQSGDSNNNNKLEVTETWIYKATYTVTQADIDNGSITNQASVNGTAPNNAIVTDQSGDSPTDNNPNVIPICTNPNINLVKNNNIEVGPNGCAILAVGDIVTYTFKVTNPGNVSLHNITVTDPHTGLSAIALQSGDSNNNNILEVTETWIYKATYTVTQTDIDNGSITNQASVNGTAPNNTVVTDQSGDSPTSNVPNVITICTNPKITLVKTNDIEVGPNGCATLAVGDVVTYTFKVFNSGNVSLHNITVTDPHTGLSAIALQSGDSNNNNILEVTETWIYKATYTVTQADIDNGNIINQASVNGTAPNNTVVTDQSGDSPTGDNPNVIPICTNPKIALVKTNDIEVGPNGCATLAVGDVVTYTFKVTNPGNVSLHNITVTDPHTGLSAIALQSGDSNNNNILEVTETWIYKATYTVTQADIDNGSITNQAYVNGTAPNNTIVTDQSGDSPTGNNPNVIPICTNPKIALVKTNNIEVGPNGCAVLAVGDVVTYTFTVTNPGNVSLHNITVTDPHTGLSAIALQSGDSNNNNILEVTETWIYKATYTVTQADIDNGSITNQASVSGTAPNNATVSDQSGDSPTGDNPNVIPICTNAGIRLVKTNDIEVGPNGCSTLAVGDVVTYTFTVTNSGIVSLHNITVTDLHAGLSAIALQSGDSNNNNILEVTETWIYKATYTVTQADIDNGSITNQASVSGTAPNDTVVSDQSGDSPAGDNPNVITFCITPGLTVTKTTTTASFSAVGDVINYTINVKNTGNTTLHQITVKDPLTGLDTVIETLAPGASLDYTQSYTVTQEDLDKGSVINVAKADGLTPTNTPVSATDDETVNESAHPIDAVDDNAGTIVGVNQITPNVINVFTNDTLNAAAVNPADVILTTVTPNPFLQLNPDGSIDVLADAPVGPQTLVYQICEKLNNTNCDSATVTVNIEAPSMTISGEGICINDVPYFSYTATANNFTPVNGLTLTWTDSKNNVVSTMTNLPLSGKVLWPGATVDQNGNGTDWPGWVLEGQKWIEAPDGFENTRPTASVTFTLNPSETIVVNYPPSDPLCTARPTFLIDAVDDTASTVDGLHGVKNILNVFNNDNLNTVAVNPADVTLSILVPDPNGAITLNTDGSVDVKENAPSGTYTLTYQICEIADAGNCDSALVTITVVNTPLVIQATNDTFSVTQCSVLEGVRNALSNDLLNGVVANPADFKFKLLTALGQFITIDDQGNITIANNVAAGQYVFDYQICEAANPNNCSTATITINVAGIESVTITIPSDRSPCNADTTPVDLFTFLPEGTPRDGVWVDSDHTGAVNGNILNAFGLPISTYHFEYKIAGDCPRSIFLVLNINDDCKVLPCKSLVIHNAFTSNEDGRNDYFQIDNLDDNDCYKNIRLEVFNRWGVLVFEKDNYNNGSNAFRGYSEGRTTINKREGLPTGTYFYILSYDTSDGLGKPQSVKKDGYLYLIK